MFNVACRNLTENEIGIVKFRCAKYEARIETIDERDAAACNLPTCITVRDDTANLARIPSTGDRMAHAYDHVCKLPGL